MTVYFLLIAIILLLPIVFSNVKDSNLRRERILKTSMIAIFLVMALKAPTVGRDIAGYKRTYELIQYRSWSNYDVSWMEWGYEFIMMVFSHLFHASFQVFIACVYAFVYYSYYKFLKRYSRDVTTSLIIYICFTYFTFDSSAIRTMIGVAICLYAVPFAEKKGIKNFFVFLAISLVAAQIHKSAYVFLIVYFVIKIRFTARSMLLYIGVPLFALLLRTQLYTVISIYFKSFQESGSALGGNLLIYIFSLMLSIYIWYNFDRKSVDQSYGNESASDYKYQFDGAEDKQIDLASQNGLAMRLVYAGIIMQLCATNSALSRLAQYMQFFILILIPNNMMRLDNRSRLIMRGILYFAAILYFWYFSLEANSLDIVPYKFFWAVM